MYLEIFSELEMIKDLNYYCKKFLPKTGEICKKYFPLDKLSKTGLNISVKDGIAPNKPILLLSVIDMMNRGQIIDNQIPLSGELAATFLNLWSHLGKARTPHIGMPFYHVKKDGFWHLQPKEECEAIIRKKIKINRM